MGFTESDLVCPDCGNYNKKSAKFCHTCGTKIEVEIVAPMDEKESYAKILENERIKAEAELERSGRYSGAKMRWSIAIGGALLLALGLLMIVRGVWGALDEMSGHRDMIEITVSWAIFGVGLFPTIFGIRYIVKA